MKNWLYNLSIRHKFVILVLVLSGFGLALAGAAFVFHANSSYRKELVDRATTLADLVGHQAMASLTFEDADEARRILESLELEPDVTLAAIFQRQGQVLAEYAKSNVSQPPVSATPSAASFTKDFLHVSRRIVHDGEEIGSIYIRSDLSSLRGRTQLYFIVGTSLLVVILTLTWWLAMLLQKVLSGPVLQLVSTARQVGTAQDYSLRAQRIGGDELGLLADEFNRMLEKIQQRDRELAEARAELEKRVEERTIDLKKQIAEREWTESELRKQKEFVHNVLDVVPSIIFVKDSEGRFVLVNRATASLYGRSAEELLGHTHHEFAAKKQEGEAYSRDDNEVLTSGTDKFIPEETFTSSNGEVRWMQTIKRRIQTADGERQLLGVATDITIRKQAEIEMRRAMEAAEAANRSKSQFLANMSHEIRTPMNGIIGMANLLLETNLDADQRECARTVASSSEALLTILSDILDISKIEAGKLAFERIPFNLFEAVEATASLMSAKAHEKGLELSCYVAGDVSCGVEGDPTRLRQVLLNLIGNAIKFTEKGEVQVTVTQLSLHERAQTLRFEIADTGVGIPANQQERLFEAFTQADGSTTRKYGGTGLGLYISRQLVQMMGGALSVTSTPGEGSTFSFTITLPLSGERESAHPSFRGRSALIVTEQASHQRIVRQYLKTVGISSKIVPDPLAAIEELRSGSAAGTPYSLAIIDTQLCGMNGNTLARSIRGEQEFSGTQVLIITSLPGDTVNELNQFGSIPCLTKPLKRAAFLNAVAQLLGTTGTAAAAPENTTTAPLAIPSTTRILIAEDNVVNQRLAVRMLGKLGLSPDVVADGVKAVAAAEKKAYDVILMDCQMPEMDGYEASGMIRRRNPEIRIVAMTANAMKGDREKCLAAGMHDYITKPLRADVMAAAISRQLEERAEAHVADAPPALASAR